MDEDTEGKILSVCVIEDDPTMQKAVERCFEDLPDMAAQFFEDGEAAWDALTKSNFDLIVLDWKLPKINGLALFNRLRQKGDYQFKPVLVMSGFLKKKDFTLLEELPFTALLEKPFTPAFFVRKVREILRTADWFQSEKPTIEKLVEALKTPDPHVVTQLVTELIAKAPNPVPIAIVAARALFTERHYVEAEHLLKSLLQLQPECLMAMSELGKVYLATKRFKEAREILQKARSISPDNLERLCLLGTAHLNLLQTTEAKECFDNALKIDKGDANAQAGVTLANNVDSFLSRQNVTSIPSTFAGLLNAAGIAFVKSSSFGPGMEHYEAALRYVGDNMSRARLAFNMGLGYWRWKKPEEAYSWFSKAVQLSDGKFAKAVKNANLVRENLQRRGITPHLLEPVDMPLSSILEESADVQEEVEFSIEMDSLEMHSSEDIETSLDTPIEVPLTSNIAAPQPSSEEAFMASEAVSKFINAAITAGEHKGTLEKKLQKLFGDYGAEAMQSVMDQAMKLKDPSASRISFLISQYKKVG